LAPRRAGYLTEASSDARIEGEHMATWVWIVIIVVVVLALMGYFGRGRLSR